MPSCLLFSSVLNCTQDWSTDPCPSVIDTMQYGWPLLMLPLLNVMCGLLLGKLVVMLAPPRPDFSRAAVAAVAFGNSTGLPITLLTVIHMSFPPTSQLGGVDPTLYLSLYLLVYPILQWGVGTLLLRKEEPHAEELVEHAQEPKARDTEASSPAAMLLVDEEDQDGSDTTTMVLPEPTRPTPWWRRRTPVLPAKVTDCLSAFLQPPVIASLVAVTIAMIPAVRGVLVDMDVRDNDAPLQWLFNAIYTMGRAAVPLNMLILGSSLAQGASWASVRWQTNLLIAFAKLVVMPAIGIGTVYVLRFLLPAGHVTPALGLVAMMVTGTPTANNVLVMVKVSGQDAEAMTTCIFTQYLLSPVILTASVALFVSVAEQLV
eukprot:GGOE01004259.1.p1 GENE.GGOE01004259.1~~GGOE01004259.1.p1  ORF type:complete len:373 (-),score=100.57 GGOE01004259.1:306-1424(-)